MKFFGNLQTLLSDLYYGKITYDNPSIKLFQEYLIDNNYDISFFNEYLNLIDTLNKYSINSLDFLNIDNIGYKQNTKNLCYFDIGFGNYYAKLDKFDLEEINLLDENDIFEYLDLTNKGKLGHGANGTAYLVDNNLVLKITQDNSEAYNSASLLNIKIPNISYIHNVYKLMIHEIQELYVIILEKVHIDVEIKNRWKQLNIDFINFEKLNVIHIEKSEIKKIPNNIIKNFMISMCNFGPKSTWKEFLKIIENNDNVNRDIDFNFVSDICEFVIDSKTNDNDDTDVPENYLTYLKYLQNYA